MPKKIIEIKDSDWLKGMSAHPSVAVGGLFQTFQGSNPFEVGGIAKPTLTGGSATTNLATIPRILTGWQASGTSYVYAHSHTKLYQALIDSPYTVTDVTNQIYQSISGNPNNTSGAKLWKGGYVYAFLTDTPGGYIKWNGPLPVGSGHDTTIFQNFQGQLDYIPLEVGADGNLYFGDAGRFGVCTSNTGTAGNTNDKYIDTDFVVRDLINDGRYLVVLADNNANNTTSRLLGAYTCRIYFWDMVQTDGSGRIVPDAVWSFKDSYIIGGKLVGNEIRFLTSTGLYVTNIATPPQMVRKLSTTLYGRPVNPTQVKAASNIFYWADGGSSISYVNAYGNEIAGQPKIFYQPYNYANSATAIETAGDTFVISTNEPRLYFLNNGTTRGGVIVTTINYQMVQPYNYSHTKVVLQSPLASGQSVTVTAKCQNNSTQISTETISYSAANAKQQLLFRRTPTANQPNRFEDLTLTITTTAGVALQRVSVYADPLDDADSSI